MSKRIVPRYEDQHDKPIWDMPEEPIVPGTGRYSDFAIPTANGQAQVFLTKHEEYIKLLKECEMNKTPPSYQFNTVDEVETFKKYVMDNMTNTLGANYTPKTLPVDEFGRVIHDDVKERQRQALDEMVALNQEMGLYDDEEYDPNAEPSPCRFNEDNILDEIRDHIYETYSGHYSRGIQTTEFIMSHAKNFDYLKGNVIKYIARYGHKEGFNRRDLLKALHYIILMMHYEPTLTETKE